jgi:hypothetical protein
MQNPTTPTPSEVTASWCEVVDRADHVLRGALDVERHHELGRLVGLLGLDTPVHVGRERDEPFGRESVADFLDLVVDAPPLLEHDHTPAGAGVGEREVPLALGAVARELDQLAHLLRSLSSDRETSSDRGNLC